MPSKSSFRLCSESFLLQKRKHKTKTIEIRNKTINKTLLKH